MCGNLKSLKQDGIRDSLLNFHKKWYSSNIMNLSVIGKFTIDQLETWVAEKFSPVKNYDVVLPDLSEPKPYPAANMGKFVKFFPIKDEDKLTFTWCLPYCQKDHKS